MDSSLSYSDYFTERRIFCDCMTYFILKEDKTPTSSRWRVNNKLILVGVQSPSKIKPPADCRAAQMYYVSIADEPLAANTPRHT